VSKVFLITEGLENLGALRTGGQGSVYKGRRIGPVISAVKVLPTPISAEDDNDKNFRNFQNEVAKLQMVNKEPNPNVVKILSSGLTESGSLPYIEMEFIEGPDLEELLKPPHRAIFTIKGALKVAEHLANALAHCHLMGVKHGDIKSNNVKYNIHTGNYVLLDFGLAIMTDEQRRTSIKHAGAVEFMAPEQNTGAIYFASEMARIAVMIAHMETPVPDLMELRKKNLPAGWSPEKKAAEMLPPQWLMNLIDTCLKKNPEERYITGMALQGAMFQARVDNESLAADLKALKEQNDVLLKQMEALQARPVYDNKAIPIRRKSFVFLVIVAIAILAFGAYSIFKKPKVKVVVKHDIVYKTTVLPPDTVYVDKHIATDSSNTSPTAPKKKRKKFLGIF
jgi:serine/threonine protein kinase